MEIENFFVNEKLKDIVVSGKTFKYKPMTSGEELDWLNDCLEEKTIKDEKTGEDRNVQVRNIGKQAILKFRNIVKVPFADEELKAITGLSKKYKNFTVEEKDLLFRKLKGDIYSELSIAIDKINTHTKKD